MSINHPLITALAERGLSFSLQTARTIVAQRRVIVNDRLETDPCCLVSEADIITILSIDTRERADVARAISARRAAAA